MVRCAAGEERETASGGEPERTCIVTRARLPRQALIRFVAGPDGVIVPDLASRLPGRGVWVECRRSTVEAAARQGAFARSLKRKVVAGVDIAERVDVLLTRRCLEALSLANKAGLVAPGYTKAEILIAQGEAIALVHGREASEDGVGKLDRRLRAVQMELDRGPDVQSVREFSIEELSLAMGRPNVVHAALRKGGAAINFLMEAGRLHSYRSIGGAGAARPSQRRLDTDKA